MNPNPSNSPSKPVRPDVHEAVEAEVEGLAAGGLGVMRLEGQSLLAPGVLPGERVLIAEVEKKRGVLRGRPAAIARPSPLRVEPDCPWHGECGGCDFLHVDAEQALRLKAQAALGPLAEGLRLPLELVEAPLRVAYRTRAVLHLDQGAAGLSVGFYDRRRRLVEFEDCRLLAPEIVALLPALRAWARTLPARFAGPELHILHGEASSGLLVTVSPSLSRGFRPGRRHSPAPAADFLQTLPDLQAGLARAAAPLAVGLFVRSQPHDRPRAAAGGLKKVVAALWPDLTVWAGPGAFTQVNPAVNRLLVEAILRRAADLAPGSALDLYSGLGNISWPLWRQGFVVTAVEESPEAARLAGAEPRPGFTQIHGRAEQAAAELAARGRAFDLICLDPPRSGARESASALAALKPRRLVYVSCHPAALARDAAPLRSLGFRPTALTAFDMFPRTSHLETMLVFERR